MTNPANAVLDTVTDESRIPMGLPQLTLEVPNREGYVRHWFADRPGRIPRALRGGFTFVSSDDVRLNNSTIADDSTVSGNTDLGSKVSVHGGVDEHGRGIRLFLMEIKQEWWDKDMALREETSERIADSLRGGRTGAERETGTDAQLRYNRMAQTDNMFSRKKRR